ncbi:uncharacterized protein S101359_02593 [Bacillus atrophaeus]|nr:uncharacterized protein S101359_02593 [Bacillus atrophaeus]
MNTHEAVENVLTDAIENGSSIQDIELTLKDMPQFDRKRARTTVITEVLAAASAAQHESYAQSPAVKKKKWLHSGGKKNNPRENHIAWTAQSLEWMKNFRYLVAVRPACFPETLSCQQGSGFIAIV